MTTDKKRLEDIRKREAEYPEYATDMKFLLAQIDRHDEVLQFYACENNWHKHEASCNEFSCANKDRGARAREALGEA